MIVLGIDVETTGLDPVNDEIIEIGAVLWDWERKNPIRIFSSFVSGHIKINDEIEKLTGITNDDRKKHGKSLNYIFETLSELTYHSDYIIAHNASFDKGFVEKHVGTAGAIWLDSMTDIDYSHVSKSKKLSYIAADHGFVNPFAHRAVFDVLTMLTVASKYDINQIIDLNKSPTITIVANVSFDEKHLAKEAGFHWDSARKQWVMETKESLYSPNNFKFTTKIIGKI